MMHFLNDGEVVHRTSNRTRIRIPQRRGNALWFAEVCTRINQLEGVTTATPNRHSATIIIRHDAGFGTENIAEALRAATSAVPEPALDIAEIGGDHFPEDHRPQDARAGEIAAIVVRWAVAVLFGTALTRVLELVAKNLIYAAVRELGWQLERGWAAV